MKGRRLALVPARESTQLSRKMWKTFDRRPQHTAESRQTWISALAMPDPLAALTSRDLMHIAGKGLEHLLRLCVRSRGWQRCPMQVEQP